MKKWATEFLRLSVLSFLMISSLWNQAQALELDWSGQFWAEFNFVHNYAMDPTERGASFDSARAAGRGYYVPGGGNQDANFQNLFLRLRPKLVVNDNIYIKSEWWVGDPIFGGIFGSSLPYSADQRQYYSNQSRGSFITAQRIWGEFVSDVGTFQVGRVPLNWGLGVVWNGGENLWDRYMSTGDAIRWIAKFGSFSLVPSVIINSSGNTIAGSTRVTPTGSTTGFGSGGVTDYSLILKYENMEDELEVGANIIKRLGGSNQDPQGGLLTPPQTSPTINGTTPGVAGSMNFLTYDIFARKKFSRGSIGAELPISNGIMNGTNMQTFGLAVEANYKLTDSTDLNLKSGYAPGQKSLTGSSFDTYRTFYFNPNYHIAMIMFNYQLANFAGVQTLNNPSTSSSQLSSIYDNPIVNAAYFSLSSNIKAGEKWTIRPNLAYAMAPQTAKDGQFYYNYWTKTIQQNTSGRDQDAGLGFEFDLGLTFQWDEYFQFSLDNGIFVPGSFYAFSNKPTLNSTSPVFASSIRIGVSF